MSVDLTLSIVVDNKFDILLNYTHFVFKCMNSKNVV